VCNNCAQCNAHTNRPNSCLLIRFSFLVLLSHHTVVWRILCLLCVILSFYLFVCTVMDFSAAEKDRGVKFCMRVGLLSSQVFPLWWTLARVGVTGAAAYVRTAHHVMARDSLPTAARVGGHWESGAAALLKAVWWDLHLASLLTHLFCVIVYSHMCAFVVLDLVPSVLWHIGCVPYFHTWCGLSANSAFHPFGSINE